MEDKQPARTSCRRRSGLWRLLRLVSGLSNLKCSQDGIPRRHPDDNLTRRAIKSITCSLWFFLSRKFWIPGQLWCYADKNGHQWLPLGKEKYILISIFLKKRNFETRNMTAQSEDLANGCDSIYYDEKSISSSVCSTLCTVYFYWCTTPSTQGVEWCRQLQSGETDDHEWCWEEAAR